MPYSKLACINAGIQQGLQLGGNGTKFIGNHDVKGCYVELGFVYYGIEEDIHEHRKFLSTPFYRPNGYDCGSIFGLLINYNENIKLAFSLS